MLGVWVEQWVMEPSVVSGRVIFLLPLRSFAGPLPFAPLYNWLWFHLEFFAIHVSWSPPHWLSYTSRCVKYVFQFQWSGAQNIHSPLMMNREMRFEVSVLCYIQPCKDPGWREPICIHLVVLCLYCRRKRNMENAYKNCCGPAPRGHKYCLSSFLLSGTQAHC